MSKKDAPAPFASIDAFREAAKAADAAGTKRAHIIFNNRLDWI